MDSNKSFECGDLMVLLSRDDGREGKIKRDKRKCGGGKKRKKRKDQND